MFFALRDEMTYSLIVWWIDVICLIWLKGKWMLPSTSKFLRKTCGPLLKMGRPSNMTMTLNILSTQQWNGLRIRRWMFLSDQVRARIKIQFKSVDGFEESSLLSLITEFYWTWPILEGRMGKYSPIKVCKDSTDISKWLMAVIKAKVALQSIKSKNWLLFQPCYSRFLVCLFFSSVQNFLCYWFDILTSKL